MVKEKKAKTPSRSEDAEQIEFVVWFRKTFPGVLIYHTPNGGLRHPVVARKMKDLGTVSGIPDLSVPEWGLWIEMKRAKGGKESEEQEKIRAYLTKKCGHLVFVAHGAKAAIDFVGKLRGI